jgi:hypothetical protein
LLPIFGLALVHSLLPHSLGFVGRDRPSHSSFVNPVAPWASLAIHGGANRPVATGFPVLFDGQTEAGTLEYRVAGDGH